MIEKAWLDSILLNTFEPIVQRSGGRVCNWEDLDSGEAVCIGVERGSVSHAFSFPLALNPMSLVSPRY